MSAQPSLRRTPSRLDLKVGAPITSLIARHFSPRVMISSVGSWPALAERTRRMVRAVPEAHIGERHTLERRRARLCFLDIAQGQLPPTTGL